MILIGFLVIISINFIISLTSYFNHNNKLRMLIIYIFFSLSLIINTILIIFSLGLSLKESFLFITIDSGGLFVIEGVLLVSLVIFRISRRDLSKIQELNEFDLWFLLILFGLLIIIVSDNLLILFTIFILIYYLFKRMFYIDNYIKEREIDNNYFIAWVVSTILLLIGILIISFYTFDFSLAIFIFVEIPDTVKNILIFIFIIAIGLSGGIFPSTLFHLRKFFRDCSYSTLFAYSLFLFISCYLIFKLIKAITQVIPAVSLIIFSIGICSVLLSSIYILIELFTTIDGLNYSVRKLFGFSVISDFSIFLLLSSIISIIQHSLTNLYLTILIFYFFSTMFIKFSLGYCYLPLISETDEDNINLLGGFGRKYKIYGIAVFLIGIFQIIIGGIMMNFLMISMNGIFNPFLEIIFYSTISVLVIYLLISIVFQASIYVHLYVKDQTEFLKFENVKRLNHYDYSFLLIQLIIVILIAIIFLFKRNYFLLFL